MPTDTGSLVTRWFDEVWNQGKEAAIEDFLHADIVVHGLPSPDGGPLRGPEGFRPLYRAFRQAFPDIRVRVMRRVASGDMEVCHCLATGTHTGSGFGLMPSGHKVEFWGMVMARIQGDRIIETWDCWDFLGMFRQLGLIPPILS